MPKNKSADETPSFDASIARLQSIIERIEQEDTPLEDSLALFEEGIKLTRQVQASLTTAEQKVRVLMEEDGEPVSKELDADD